MNEKVPPQPDLPNILILTPVKDAMPYAAGHFERLRGLTYPHDAVSVGILESDSRDNTYSMMQELCKANESQFRKITLIKKDFGYRIPQGVPRWDASVQFARRSVLARSRNHLLISALRDEDWVLWLDVDVIRFPRDIIEKLLAYGKDILQPHCVKQPGGPTFDRNAWRDRGQLHMDAMRNGNELEQLDAVGGTMLMVRAECHRDGLMFPTFLYGKRNSKIRKRDDIGLPDDEGEIETEGFGILADDMGFECWGIPGLEVIHANR